MSHPQAITAELSDFVPKQACIVARQWRDRGQTRTPSLNSYHTFSFGAYDDQQFRDFGSLRVLNEDHHTASQSGSPHAHRNVEIITYVTRGQVTSITGNDHSILERGQVQLITTGHGTSHAQHTSTTGQCLNIWVVPWAHALTPQVHHLPVSHHARPGFNILVSPYEGGVEASTVGQARVPAVPGSIPINADFLVAAATIADGKSAVWLVGGGGVASSKEDRHVYIHVPMADGKSKVRLADQTVLGEGDGAFITNLSVGDRVVVESVGVSEVEVVVLDSA
ncbi:MAG: hypothetical protein Q9218_005293 [Villophora microphyllina]